MIQCSRQSPEPGCHSYPVTVGESSAAWLTCCLEKPSLTSSSTPSAMAPPPAVADEEEGAETAAPAQPPQQTDREEEEGRVSATMHAAFDKKERGLAPLLLEEEGAGVVSAGGFWSSAHTRTSTSYRHPQLGFAALQQRGVVEPLTHGGGEVVLLPLVGVPGGLGQVLLAQERHLLASSA